MQRWEYLSTWLIWDEDETEHGDLWSSTEVPSPRSMTELLAGYGAEGWELVAFQADEWRGAGGLGSGGSSEVTTYCAVFKRPRAARPPRRRAGGTGAAQAVRGAAEA